MSNEAQLNVRVPKQLKQKIREEVARHNTTHEIVLTSILSDFFKSKNTNERGAFYKSIGQRPYGRTA